MNSGEQTKEDPQINAQSGSQNKGMQQALRIDLSANNTGEFEQIISAHLAEMTDQGETFFYVKFNRRKKANTCAMHEGSYCCFTVQGGKYYHIGNKTQYCKDCKITWKPRINDSGLPYIKTQLPKKSCVHASVSYDVDLEAYSELLFELLDFDDDSVNE